MAKYCPDCGTPSASATSKFCGSCGHPLDAMTKPAKTSRASVEDDPDGSDITEVPDITSLSVVSAMDEEEGRFGKTFSFGGGNFAPSKFKPRSLSH